MNVKKVSAFTVFNSDKNTLKKKTKDNIPHLPPTSKEEKSMIPLRRAQSSQSMERGEKHKESNGGSGSRGKRFLNALRSGHIRESIRLSGKKNRPSSLTSLDHDSPFPGLAKISLVGPKKNSNEELQSLARKRLLDTLQKDTSLDKTPVSRKSPRDKSTPKDGKNTPNKVKSSAEKPHKTPPVAKSSPRQTKPHPEKPPKVSPPLPKVSTQISKALLEMNSSTEELPVLKQSTANQTRVNNVIHNVSEEQKEKRGKKRKDSEASNSSKKKRKTDRMIKVSATDMELPYMYDSTAEAKKLFECMIHPVKTDRFFTELWERKPLLVKRHTPDYNKGWFSTAEFDKILRQENIQWGVNLDATSFIDDKRETHNQSGRAHAPVVWDLYQAGCSLRLLNPQTYSRNVWKVLSVLQEYFGCCVGANIYLTPPGTQGFAPHYDDIEAFILQLEGKKHWRLYSPRTDDEILPRFSSKNFSQSEIGEPILDTVLEAGDLLYFPRGTIHQGDATDEHSLHITVSCYQLNTWGDLLQKLLPAAIEMALQESVEFREGLPRNYLSYMGIVNSEKEVPERKEFIDKVQSLVSNLIGALPIDSACDQMGKQLMYDSMPPVLTEVEKSCSIHGAGERWDPTYKRVVGVSELQPETVVKLIRKGVLRLLTEEDKVRIYYNVENARVYRSTEPNFIEITAEMAPAVEYLINAYPEYTSIESLPLENIADQINVVSLLYEKGLLITSEPLEPTYDEPGDDTDEEFS
ncbi:ribosomal oxygenase 1-like [Physella acuta]|uniref:ribosomal oxygenase 1-like n=1 Tax=Physella acuta TaxID=109671 RepID=UPI0027DB0381|nr:ribosomal oxygenase 1-like [Physella acuta]